MSNVPLPRPGPLGLIQYAGVDMLQYAGEISAAKDAEIAALRDFVEHVRRNGSTHLANMAVAVLAAQKGEA